MPTHLSQLFATGCFDENKITWLQIEVSGGVKVIDFASWLKVHPCYLGVSACVSGFGVWSHIYCLVTSQADTGFAATRALDAGIFSATGAADLGGHGAFVLQ